MKEAQDLLDETWYSTWVRALHNHHNALLHQNATCWGQRAKAQWLNNGDQNSSYFQNSVKIRHHRNKVGNIKDTSSNTFSTHSEIETCFLFFFFFLNLSGHPLLPILLILCLWPFRMILLSLMRRIELLLLDLSPKEKS